MAFHQNETTQRFRSTAVVCRQLAVAQVFLSFPAGEKAILEIVAGDAATAK